MIAKRVGKRGRRSRRLSTITGITLKAKTYLSIPGRLDFGILSSTHTAQQGRVERTCLRIEKRCSRTVTAQSDGPLFIGGVESYHGIPCQRTPQSARLMWKKSPRPIA